MNSIWCFGDSAGIDFSSPNNPIAFKSSIKSRGSCASIANSAGRLLFYAHTRASIVGNSGLIYDSTHQLMQNGDNILGQGWYNELTIVPKPGTTNEYYLFSIGVTNSSQQGLFYSIIDMNLNGGLGAVVSKNILINSDKAVDCLSAVKHGNGRDWWIIYREFATGNNGNARYYMYLISPSGISLHNSQAIGTKNQSNAGQITFNITGTKLSYINPNGLVEIINFNRCTGQLYQAKNIEPERSPVPFYFSSEFSSNSNYLYVTQSDINSYVFQYDLNLFNPAFLKDTIWTYNSSVFAGGHLKRAPNQKIYLSCIWNNGFQFPYPYADTMFHSINTTLSVIDQPNLPGSACNFQPFSFSLGGNRTYLGLPNNPDYELDVLSGSICDTIVSFSEYDIKEPILTAYYDLNSDILFVNAQNLKGKSFSLSIININGQQIYFEQGSCYKTLTRNLQLNNLVTGIYIVRANTEKETLYFKFLRQ